MDDAPSFGDVNTATEAELSQFDVKKGPGTSIPFHDSAQDIVLFSISHVGMPPIATNAKAPAVRFYGCFANREAASTFATRIIACDAKCNIQMASTHSWILACSNMTKCTNAQYCDNKVARLLAHHTATEELSKAAFLKRTTALRQAGSEPDIIPDITTTHTPTETPPVVTSTASSFLFCAAPTRGKNFSPPAWR